jgi:ketosteroid isomerase-like protein
MAQPTADQFVRDMYAAFVSEGLPAATARFMDDQVEYADDPRWPGGGTHHGREAVVARFEEVAEVLGIVAADVERVVEAGDQVAWIVRFSGQSPREGVPNDHRWGYVGRISDARLVSFRAYYDPAEAFAAAGVRA